jgi:hypothetical protein
MGYSQPKGHISAKMADCGQKLPKWQPTANLVPNLKKFHLPIWQNNFPYFFFLQMTIYTV